MNRKFKAIWILFALVGALFTPASAATITMSWDSSLSTNVTGYAVYYGYKSGDYPTRIDAKDHLSQTISVQDGTNYFFVVTAYIADGMESLPSEEISYLSDTTVPQIVITTPGSTFTTTNNSINLSGTASDDFGVTQITWSNRCSGVTGVASGTMNWTANGISLCSGSNVLEVKAQDAAGNVGSALITITRNVESCTYAISPTSWSAGAAGGGATVSISTGASCDWINSAPCGWLTVSRASGTGSSNITVSASNNTGTSSRSCSVTIAGQTFTVTQAGASSDTTAPQVVIASPGTSTFTTTNSTINLSGTSSDNVAVSQVTWSNQCSSASGVTIGSANWAANNISLCGGQNVIMIRAKDAAGNVGSATMTIIRDELPCTYTISQSNWDVGATGGNTTVSISAGGSCDWTISAPCEWLTVSRSNGTGSGNLTVTANGNTSRDSRSCNLTLAGKTLTVTQAGTSCNYNVSSSTTNFTTAGGSGSLRVTTGAICDWEANVSGGSDWLHLISGNSGTGNGTAQFAADPNTNCSSRIGSITAADFVVTITQNGLASESLPSATYSGLFTNTLAADKSGYFTLKKGGGAGFSGNINLAGLRRSFSGKFDSNGIASVSIKRTDADPLVLQLEAEPCDRDHLAGTLVDGDQAAPLIADRMVFNSRTNPTPFAGNYTLAILGLLEEPTLPGGIGFAAAKVLSNGSIRVKGTLGDGKNFAQSAQLSKDGYWPFYAQPYRRPGGSISGWLIFDQAESGLHGDLAWVKPLIEKDKFYPAGFSNSVAAIGSNYNSPGRSTNSVIHLLDGTVTLGGGELVHGFTKDIMLLTNKIVPIPKGEDQLSFRISKASGLFSGSVIIPGNRTRVKFRGSLLQNKNAGYGLFLGTNQTGQILLEPTP